MDKRTVVIVAATALTTAIVTTAVVVTQSSSTVQSPTSFYFCASPSGVPEGITYAKLGSPPTNCRSGYTDIWSSDGWVKSGTPTSTTSTSTTTTTRPATTTTTTTVPTPTLDINKPFAATSPWNTPTPSGTQWNAAPAVLSSSDWWFNGGWRAYYAVPSDPLWTFQMPDFIAPAWNRNRPAQTFQMRAPVDIAASPDSDGQLAVVEPDGSYVEVWQASVNANTRVVTSNPGPGWATGNAITGLGVGGLVAQGGNNAGTRAANFSFQAGRITLDQINGAVPIDHALVVCLPASMLMQGASPQLGVNYRLPATAPDSGPSQYGTIMMGSKIGIPAGVTMPTGLAPLTQKIFRAMQTYGMFVGDFCGGAVPILQSDQAAGFWLSDMKTLSPLLRIAA